MTRIAVAIILAAVILVKCGAAKACDLALVLAFDISASLDTTERGLMMRGIAGALRHSWVASAFLGQSAQVQVVVFADQVQPLTGWVPINATDDLHDLAAMLDAPPPMMAVGSGTRINHAVTFAADSLAKVQCEREILDIMTDGEDYNGPANTAPFEDWQTINVLLLGTSPAGAIRAAQLRHGPDGFIWPLASLDDLTNALAEKMIQEVS